MGPRGGPARSTRAGRSATCVHLSGSACAAMRPGGSDGVCVYVLPRLPAVRSIDHTRHQCKRSNAPPGRDRMHTAPGGAPTPPPAPKYRTFEGFFLPERSRYGKIGYTHKAFPHFFFFFPPSPPPGGWSFFSTAT